MIYVYELGLGFIQLNSIDAMDIKNELSIKGSLQNSGIYACYLAIHLPFLYFFFFQILPIKTKPSNSKFKILSFIHLGKTIVFSIILITAILLIIKTCSRTAYIALSIVFFGHISHKYYNVIRSKFKPVSKKIILSSWCLILVSGFACVYWMYNVKKMSAVGRIMKIDIALQHLTENFWFGTGLGRFTWYYPQWQASYFQHSIHPPLNYFLCAGESYILFNEYLQLFEEIGSVGFVIFLIVLIWFYRRKSNSNKYLMYTLKLTTSAILSCGFTSYPFHITIFVLLLFFCISVALILADYSVIHKQLPTWFSSQIRMLSIITFSLTVIFGYYGTQSFLAVKKWQHLRTAHDLNDNKYESVYTILYNNGKFLTDYGEVLTQHSHTQNKAIQILEQSKKYIMGRNTIGTTAKAYAIKQDYLKAIDNISFLTYFLPNKFSPKYELLKLYKQINDTTKAIQVAKMIIVMPEKIPSEKTEFIKIYAAETLKQIQP